MTPKVLKLINAPPLSFQTLDQLLIKHDISVMQCRCGRPVQKERYKNGRTVTEVHLRCTARYMQQKQKHIMHKITRTSNTCISFILQLHVHVHDVGPLIFRYAKFRFGQQIPVSVFGYTYIIAGRRVCQLKTCVFLKGHWFDMYRMLMNGKFTCATSCKLFDTRSKSLSSACSFHTSEQVILFFAQSVSARRLHLPLSASNTKRSFSLCSVYERLQKCMFTKVMPSNEQLKLSLFYNSYDSWFIERLLIYTCYHSLLYHCKLFYYS